MASTGQLLSDFLAQTADLTDEVAFRARFPFPFLVQEEMRLSGGDDPIPGAGARGTMRISGMGIPRGLGDGSRVYPVCPKDPENFAGAVTLGRDPQCDVVVDDPSVSIHHASFTLEVTASDERVVRVADAGSTNGTFVDGDEVPKGTAEVLEDSSSLRVGPVCKFQFFTPESLYMFLSFYRRMKG